MLSLPYDFDTAATWEKIIKIFLIVAGVYAATLFGLVLQGQFVAGIVLSVIGFALWRMIRLIPARIGMGARGRLTAADVTTRTAKVWRYSLNVPVGRFPISQFSEVAIAERVIVIRPETVSGSLSNTGSVLLVGRNGTPDIEMMVDTIEAANAFAKELSATLGLPVRPLATPGSRITEIHLRAANRG